VKRDVTKPLFYATVLAVLLAFRPIHLRFQQRSRKSEPHRAAQHAQEQGGAASAKHRASIKQGEIVLRLERK